MTDEKTMVEIPTDEKTIKELSSKEMSYLTNNSTINADADNRHQALNLIAQIKEREANKILNGFVKTIVHLDSYARGYKEHWVKA